MKLRPYQRQAVNSVLESFRENGSALVVLPTGTGKTILFADVIRRMFPRRVIVLAHREELIFQAKEKIEHVTGLPAEIEMADSKIDMGYCMFDSPRIVVSSIQTQNAGGDGLGRMSKFVPDNYGLLVIDEAHHAVAKSYRRVIDYYRQNPNLKVLGVTATPDRADEEALGQVFHAVAFDYEILDAIHDGWLVPIDQQIVDVDGLDFSTVRTTCGDLNGADLAALMEYEENLQGIAIPTVELIGDRRALVFSASVAHAERLSEIFNRYREGCSTWICGKTKKDDRRRILRDYAEGKYQILCNCGVLTEGFDDPGVEVVVMGRPTKSRALYAQMVGRGTRPFPGVVDSYDTDLERRAAIAASRKPSCLVVDFVGNAGRHKLMTTANILGGNVSDAAIDRAVEQARTDGGPVRMDDVLDHAESEIAAEQERETLREMARRARLKGQANWTARAVNPFDVFNIVPAHERGWDKGRQLSEKQHNMLLKQGINPDNLTYAQARQIIGEMFRRWDGGVCTFKQANTMKKYGYPTDVSKQEASKIIDALAANNWRDIGREKLRELVTCY